MPSPGKRNATICRRPDESRLELGQDARTDEHHFVAARALFAERPSRLDLHQPMRHFVEQIGEMGLKARRDERLTQGHTLRCRLPTPTRHLALSPMQEKMRLLKERRKLLYERL